MNSFTYTFPWIRRISIIIGHPSTWNFAISANVSHPSKESDLVYILEYPAQIDPNLPPAVSLF